MILLGFLGLGLGAYVVLRLVRAYVEFRGRRLIICPESHRPAAVELDAGRAARASLAGRPDLRLHDCSRWPERAGCGQECLAQIESAPEDCLVRNLLVKYYRGATCALCGRPIGVIHPAEPKPAFLAPAGSTVRWAETRAEELPEIFATHKPVCSSCEVAESFRRKFPEMVVDRETNPSGVRNAALH